MQTEKLQCVLGHFLVHDINGVGEQNRTEQVRTANLAAWDNVYDILQKKNWNTHST